MTSAAFSPGPYFVVDKTGEKNRFDVRILTAGITEASNPTPRIATIHTPRSWQEGLATAQLLADAPALYILVEEQLLGTPPLNWMTRASTVLSRIQAVGR